MALPMEWAGFGAVILYVRDEIAIPGIGQKIQNYMSYLLTVFSLFGLNMLGLTPLGVNITGNIAMTFSLALMTYIT